MENLAPHWRSFLNNLRWYILALTVLFFLSLFLRTFPVMLILWVVGIAWGLCLAFQLPQLMSSRNRAQLCPV